MSQPLINPSNMARLNQLVTEKNKFKDFIPV